MIETLEQSQMQQLAAVESYLMGMLSIDESDAHYQSLRSTTTIGLEIASLLTGGYGAVKGVLGFTKLARTPMQVAKIAGKVASQEVKYILRSGLGRSIDFIASSNGILIPRSRALLESGFQRACFRTFQTRSSGMGYILPNGSKVRIMDPAGRAPLRASFTNTNGGPINPFTGKPPQPPKGMDGISRRQFVRENSHLELIP